MKKFVACVASLLVSACASQMTFVEHETGLRYSGNMQSAVLEDGRVSAIIDGVMF